MISIRTATNELDRLEAMLRTVTEVYGQGVNSIAHYAVEIEPRSADEFRTHMQTLQRHAMTAETVEQWRKIQSSVRGELRDYRDKSAEALKRLRAEIQAASEAIQVFAESVSATDSGVETWQARLSRRK